MNKKPLISIVMPVYNAENCIQEAIESLLQQTYKNIEILIMDDGSTDTTWEILKQYKNVDKRISLFSNKKNIGLTKSLNVLISKSKGEYIARQDADDISLPERFQTQFQLIEKHNLDFCTARAIVKNSNRKIPFLSFYIPKRFILKFKNPFIHGTLIINKEVLIKIGLYDEKYYYSQDYLLMRRLLMNRYKYKFIRKPLYILNTSNNISSLKKEEQQKYAKAARKEF